MFIEIKVKVMKTPKGDYYLSNGAGSVNLGQLNDESSEFLDKLIRKKLPKCYEDEDL